MSLLGSVPSGGRLVSIEEMYEAIAAQTIESHTGVMDG